MKSAVGDAYPLHAMTPSSARGLIVGPRAYKQVSASYLPLVMTKWTIIEFTISFYGSYATCSKAFPISLPLLPRLSEETGRGTGGAVLLFVLLVCLFLG